MCQKGAFAACMLSPPTFGVCYASLQAACAAATAVGAGMAKTAAIVGAAAVIGNHTVAI